MIMVLESGLFKMDYMIKKLVKIEHNVANGNIEWVVQLKQNDKFTHMISKSFKTGQLSL
jgi:nitrogen fixation/metabolism regulation signal transduction histidine kinase